MEKRSNFSSIFICPKCKKNEFWQTRDNRLKCKKCRYLFTPKENFLKIPEETLREVISDFLLEHSTNIILERIKISKYKLLKVLALLRILMTKEVIESFNGKIKVNKNYFENEMERILKNKKTEEKENEEEVIGIFCDEKKCFAKTLPEIKIKELKFFLKKEDDFKNINWQSQIAISFKNSLYRITKPNRKIDILSVFWGYLKKKLSERGGIRKNKLPFYLGEYSWRFNNRKKNLKEKEEILLNILWQYFKNYKFQLQ